MGSLVISSKSIRSGFIVFTVTAILAFGVAYQSYLINQNKQHSEVLKELNSVNYRLTNALSNASSASKTLAFIVNRYGFPYDFDSIAKKILESNKFIDALELTKKGIITNVYPLIGNEAAIGYDLLRDSIARKEAYTAIRKKELYFAGPLELKQGGIAVVGRLPFFKNAEFEGFSIVIIKLPTLLEASGIDLGSDHFSYQLSKTDPETLEEEFLLPAAIPIDLTQSASVMVPAGDWKLYVAQRKDKLPLEVIVTSILGFLLSVIAALFARHMTKKPEMLKQLVDQKTAELIRIKKTAVYSEARLAEAQEVAKIGSWETDLENFKVKWSKETFRILEMDEKKGQLLHSDFLARVHPEDVKKVEEAFINSTSNEKLNVLEHRIITEKGKIKYVQECWRVLKNAEGVPIKAIGTCYDITDQKKTELALKESEKRYKYLFENNPMPMALWDFYTRRVVDCNHEALLKYGYSKEEFMNLTMEQLRPEEDIPLAEAAMQSEAAYGAIHKKVWRHKKKNGEIMYLNITAHLIDYDHRRVSLVLLDDITEKLKAEEELLDSYTQLRKLTVHLQMVREEERTRIAREIHDELGQQLTALKMDASWISRKVHTDDAGVMEKLTAMIDLIDDTVKAVRRISTDLRPGILDDLGLVPALEWQGEEYAQRTGIKWRFTTNISDIVLDPNISTGIFRIFQEASTNIIKHSRATEVETIVEKRTDSLILIIKDNGQGFDVDKPKNKDSWGIAGMKERAAFMEGDLKIESGKPKGTILTLTVPLNNNRP